MVTHQDESNLVRLMRNAIYRPLRDVLIWSYTLGFITGLAIGAGGVALILGA